MRVSLCSYLVALKAVAFVSDNANQNTYIMMKARTDSLFKKPADFTILSEFLGETLKGLKYMPLFTYFVDRTDVKGFVVLTDEYVTEESGTGIVHQAPYFGEVPALQF